MPSSSNNIHTLEIDSVDLSFGDRNILSSVYLRLDTGKITALLGRNGCGKSCLMRVLFDELRPTYKSIRLDSVWRQRLSNTQVLYLPQNSSIPGSIRLSSVFSDFNVSFDDFCTYFPEFGSFARKRVRDLSSGERRIVEIYVILKANSQFVMLDEPFLQVMPLHISTLKSLIMEQKQHKGILLTDHMYRNVIDISDSLYVISNQTVYLTKHNDDLVKYGYVSNYDSDK